MHTALVISAYLAMIFVPCACAQWGDVLTAEWWHYKLENRRASRRRSSVPALAVDPLLASVRAQRVAIEIETLAAGAFAEPVVRMPRLAASSARKMPQPAMDSASFQRASARVAARLNTLSEAYRRAHAPEPPQTASPRPSVAAAPPPAIAARAHTRPVEQVQIESILVTTPTPRELEALYALEGPALPIPKDKAKTSGVSVAA